MFVYCNVSYIISVLSYLFVFFSFNHMPTTQIYTLSLHDALPICYDLVIFPREGDPTLLIIEPQFREAQRTAWNTDVRLFHFRSEEHTSELQSLTNLVCRLLLEKKKKTKKISYLTERQESV